MVSSSPGIRIRRYGLPGARPALSDLAFGQLAINYADGKLFARVRGTDGLDRIEVIGAIVSLEPIEQRLAALEATPTWETLTPTTKFTTLTSIQISKSKDGVVFMRGTCREVGSNGIAQNDTVLTLPTAYCPSRDLTGFVCDPAGAFGARLDISTTGNIKIFWDSLRGYPGFGGSVVYVNFENVQFPTW